MEIAATTPRYFVEQNDISFGTYEANIQSPFANQSEFSSRVNSQVDNLEDEGLIDQSSADFLRELVGTSDDQQPLQQSLSFSNPISALLVAMLDLALKTQSLVNVHSIDLSNIKLEKSKDLAQELINNAALAFGVTVVGAVGSLAVGYKMGQMLGKSGGKGGINGDPETASWAPITTNMAFQISSSAVDIVKAGGQGAQQSGEADISRSDQTKQLLDQTSSDYSGLIQRLNQQ